MNRRIFLKNTALTSLAALSIPQKLISAEKNAEKYIMTVNGQMEASKLGLILTHEHVMSNFGQEPSYIGQFDEIKLKEQVLPYLNKVKSLGCNTLVECTTAYFGRNVKLLKEFSDSSGLNIITNTGWYAAAKDRYVPEKAYKLSTDEIAEIWINEWKNGINNTDIKPGFIKLAVDNGPISDIDKKLIIAGAKTHLATGLVMQVHTGNNPEAASIQLKTLKDNGVSPNVWIWTHAHNASDAAPLIEVAKEGAWISLDGIRYDKERQEHILKLLKDLAAAGFLNQILLSHDGNSFPSGKEIRPYDTLMTEFIPRLLSEGFTDNDIEQLTVKNPQNAFTIGIRKT
jgi:phosphotriesterase-related protein